MEVKEFLLSDSNNLKTVLDIEQSIICQVSPRCTHGKSKLITL